jgi:hypothetical protein
MRPVKRHTRLEPSPQRSRRAYDKGYPDAEA